MNTPIDYTLKIADTPQDDGVSLPDVHAEASCSPDRSTAAQPAPTKPSRLSNIEGKRRGRRGSVQKLTPEEIDQEIDRVQRLNGRPTLARGTYPD
jgi:hypothetical protein